MSKERITITLASSILAKIDQLIDKKTIRNRSHAIEHILSQHILSKVTKVVILAAGKGVKMRPLTYELPKSMVPVHDIPLLAHTIRSLSSAGLKDIVIVTGHLGQKIRGHFGDGEDYGVRITYVEDKVESGTAQALSQVESAVGADPFLLIYGDVLSDLDWLRLIDFHKGQNALVSMAVTTSEKTESWGMVRLEGSRIVGFKEKPQAEASTFLINTGLYVIDPEALQLITAEMASFEEEVLSQLLQEGRLAGYHFSGKWFDVGSPEGYERALTQWQGDEQSSSL